MSSNGNSMSLADALPPGVSEQQAEAMMAEANDWHMGLQSLQPTPLRFSASVVHATLNTPDGPVPTRVVRLKCFHANGVNVMHLPPELCEGLIGLLEQYGAVARTGLITATHTP